jgi:hypothetical protein
MSLPPGPLSMLYRALKRCSTSIDFTRPFDFSQGRLLKRGSFTELPECFWERGGNALRGPRSGEVNGVPSANSGQALRLREPIHKANRFAALRMTVRGIFAGVFQAVENFVNRQTPHGRGYLVANKAKINSKICPNDPMLCDIMVLELEITKARPTGRAFCVFAPAGQPRRLSLRKPEFPSAVENLVNRQKLHDRAYLLANKGEIFVAKVTLSPFAACYTISIE